MIAFRTNNKNIIELLCCILSYIRFILLWCPKIFKFLINMLSAIFYCELYTYFQYQTVKIFVIFTCVLLNFFEFLCTALRFSTEFPGLASRFYAKFLRLALVFASTFRLKHSSDSLWFPVIQKDTVLLVLNKTPYFRITL